MLGRSPRHPREAPFTARTGHDPERAADELGSDQALRDVIDAGLRVERLHVRGADAALQTPQGRHGPGGPAGEVFPPHEHGAVLGEGVAIVDEDAQALRADLGIGRVEVGHVDGTGRESPVGHVVVEPPHLLLREPVAGAERRKAIGAVHDLVGEPEAQLGVAGQVGDGADAQLLCEVLAHPERVAVLEAERPAHDDAAGPEGEIEAVLVACVGALDELLGERPRVLRVDVESRRRGARPTARGFRRARGHARSGRPRPKGAGKPPRPPPPTR